MSTARKRELISGEKSNIKKTERSLVAISEHNSTKEQKTNLRVAVTVFLL